MMKAAVLHNFGEIPRYEDFPDPMPRSNDVPVKVRAAALTNSARVTAKGTHYTSRKRFPTFPAIVGNSGVGELADGSLLWFGGTLPPYGAMAELAVIPEKFKMFTSLVPTGVDPAGAAAAQSTVFVSILSLKYAAKLQLGETVLINGATGGAGRATVQVAKLLGAGRVVGTGRNDSSLRILKELGADAVIDLKEPDDQVSKEFAENMSEGYDVIIDFLWGHPTELLLKTMVPTEQGLSKHRTRLIQVGESAGQPAISLYAEMLRTSGLEIYGAGDAPSEAMRESIEQGWKWMKLSKLRIDIERVQLKDVAEAWNRDQEGKRIVITP
jgi:NADPH:quinone reductase-like Zn-dependent oxidoreductase